MIRQREDGRVVVMPDLDEENADWTKRTWDLPTDLAEFLRGLEQTGMSVAEFKTLPVYRFNLKTGPSWLKDL